jgi:nucleoside-diphosphate-sugar epimerase
MDNLSSGKTSNLGSIAPSVEFIQADIRSKEDCQRACSGVEFVFHVAAIASVPASVADPRTSSEVNIDGTLHILEAARDQKCKRVIYASSSSAYGNSPESPKLESLRPQPLSPYAVQKLAAEMYCQAFTECYGLETLSLRYINVFGPRQDPAGQYAAAIPAFVTAAVKGQAPTVFGDGDQTRDFTYIDNVVDANMLAMEAAQASGEAMNIACGRGISINEVIQTVYRVLNRPVQIHYAEPRVGDVRHSTADITLAQRRLGYSPRVDLEQGLRLAIDWYLANVPS